MGPSAKTMNIYPPHDTLDYLRCGVYRQLRKDWEPIAEWQPNMMLGNAIGSALETYYTNRGDATPDTLAWEAAEKIIERDYVDQPTWTIEGLKKLAARGLSAALKQADFILQTENVIGVEMPIGECRPDLITRSKSTGKLIVTDGKVSLNLDSRWESKRLAEYDSDHQFWHYAWRVGEHFGEPVEWVRVHLTVLSPKTHSLLHPIAVTPERVSFWLQGAERAWQGMTEEQEGRATPAPNFASCHGRYGRCPFYEACHVYFRRSEQMRVLYVERNKPDVD